MRKNLFVALALGLSLAAVSSAAVAEDRSYTFVEGGYQYVDVDGFGKATDGVFLGGSYEVKDSGFYVHGKYTHLSDDFNINPREYKVGVGYYHTLNDRLDVLGEAGYHRLDTSVGHADAYSYSAGVRGSFTKAWEGVAKVNHYTGGDMAGSNTTGLLGVQYNATDVWAVVGDVEFDGDVSTYQVGVRAKF